ncbi:monovalent cation/H+ antiporter subunit D [Novispirillum sp. DQ9]|uniref:monovalent cation/H+ antiporter subunit D n=1 Tax=Novispirillum sp. DQ9 TaxID=3398612 RepID=UPI003C7A967B
MSLHPEHLVVAPIVLPLFMGALMLLYGDSQRRAKLVLSLVSSGALLVIALQLLGRAATDGAVGQPEIVLYRLGSWPPAMGIVLVLDRLSALMLVLTAVLAIPVLLYSAAGWHRQGQHYYSIFQFLLVGLNGAFLTGDLFNLFVFFEVLLAASYGLLLHGSGRLRVRAGLHYIAVNLAASLLFLVGVSLLYGLTGTLNMGNLAAQVAQLPGDDRALFHAAAATMGLAFLIKAGIWPLSFWLPTAYMASPAPVAAVFAIMTKVGLYVVLRLSILLFGPAAGPSTGFGSDILVAGGIATMTFGMVGVLGSQVLGRIAAHSVLITSGTLLAIIGFVLGGGGTALLSGALYYLISSTLAVSALFLLIELMSREQSDAVAGMLALTAATYRSSRYAGIEEDAGDDGDGEEAGPAIPGTLAILAACFAACGVLLAGLPPLSGFIGKLAMLSGVLQADGTGYHGFRPMLWGFAALLLLSGFATLIALTRIGIQAYWLEATEGPRVLLLEIVPVLVLLGLAAGLAIMAEDVLLYTEATARALRHSALWIEGVIQMPHLPRIVPGELP